MGRLEEGMGKFNIMIQKAIYNYLTIVRSIFEYRKQKIDRSEKEYLKEFVEIND
jgi:hypothetical protein